nr:protein adenylyltransferase SelO family protein [Xenococcaceae cyanobacterium MO_167.B52]
LILENASFNQEVSEEWRNLYHLCLNKLPEAEMEKVCDRLNTYNPQTYLVRPLIESVWAAITQEDNWEPFYNLVESIA